MQWPTWDVQTGFFQMLVFLIITESGKKSGEKHMQRRFLMKPPFKAITKYLGIYTKPKSYGCKETK